MDCQPRRRLGRYGGSTGLGGVLHWPGLSGVLHRIMRYGLTKSIPPTLNPELSSSHIYIRCQYSKRVYRRSPAIAGNVMQIEIHLRVELGFELRFSPLSGVYMCARMRACKWRTDKDVGVPSQSVSILFL